MTIRYVTLRRVQRGKDSAATLRRLMKKRGMSVADLARATKIRPSTITAYSTTNKDARRRMGLKNGTKIAKALAVEISVQVHRVAGSLEFLLAPQ